jgi:transcriptional regulator with XRE-family HTH domain
MFATNLRRLRHAKGLSQDDLDQVLHVTCNLTKGRRCDLANLIRYLQGRLFNIG